MFSFWGIGFFADMSGGKHWLFNICPQILLLREMWARNVGKFNLQYPHSWAEDSKSWKRLLQSKGM